LGVVVDVIPAGNDLLEVKLNQSAEQPDKPSTEAVTKAGKKRRKSQPKSPKPAKVLIPFVKAIVPVDLKMVAWKLRHHWVCWIRALR